MSVNKFSTSSFMAWRYLLPGVAAMLVFIAFPLFYTVGIGFTNYSSNNLLSEERSRAYLLEQTEVDESATWAFSQIGRASCRERV